VSASETPANKPSNAEAQREFLMIRATWDRSHTGRAPSAAEQFRELQRKYPGTLEADLSQAEILRIQWKLGDQQAALQGYRDWIASSPSPAAQGLMLGYLADAAKEAADYVRAEGLYREAAQLAGGHLAAGLARLQLADMYVTKLRRYQEAVAMYEGIAKDFAGTLIEAEARRYWAKTLAKVGSDSGTQLAALQPALESTDLSPNMAHAKHNLAEVLLALGRTEEAISVFQTAARGAVPTERWSEDCLRTLFVLQRSTGKFGDAVATGRRYLELFPSPEADDICLGVAECLQGAGDISAALDELKKIAKEAPAGS